MAPTAKPTRQPTLMESELMKYRLTSAAIIAPTDQKFITSAFTLPRLLGGMNSLIAELMAVYSAPTPMAVRKRKIMSTP